MPFASILIPTYNQAEFLCAALDSVLVQTDQDWEAVVVDDGSTDTTAAVLADYAARDPRIRPYHQTNGGVGAALNRAFAEARGEWIHWLSSDDLFEPGKLALNRRYIDAAQDVDFFFSRFRLLRHASGVIEDVDLWGPLPPAGFEVLGLMYRNFVSGISICVRRQRWLAVGAFDAALRYGQDYDMWLRLLLVLRAAFIPERTVISRHHAAQGSEQFAAACYYDSARAALRVLATHTFDTLCPQVDLRDGAAAERAYQLAMAAASDPSSFVYRLGIHPLLAGRLQAWLWNDLSDPVRQGLRRRFARSAGELAVRHRSTEFGRMWAALHYGVAADLPLNVRELDLVALARRSHARLTAARHVEAGDLARYLLSMGLDVTDVVDRYPLASVLILDPARSPISESLALSLSVAGHAVVRIGNQLTVDEGGLQATSGAAAFDDDRALARLGQFDVVVDRSERALYRACVCDQYITAADVLRRPDEDETSALLRSVRARLPGHDTPSDERQRVVLFAYTDSGGGAEKVLAQLARKLDRSRYAVEVVTLFRSGLRHELPAGVPVYCLSEDVVQIVAPLTESAAGAADIGATVAEPYRSLHAPDWELVEAVASRIPRQLRTLVRKLGLNRHAVRALRLIGAWRGKGSYPAARLWHARRRQNPGVLPTAAAPSVTDTQPPAGLASSAIGGRLAAYLDGLPDNVRIVTFMEHAALYMVAVAAQRLPAVVATFHTHESSYLDTIFPDATAREFARAALATMAAQARACTFPGRGCADDFLTEIAPGSSAVRVVENPVDAALIRFLSAGARDAALEAWVAARPLVVCLARLDATKDHQALLTACVSMRARGVDFALLNIGGGPLQASLESLTAQLCLQDCVRYTGMLDNPFPWLGRAHALVLSSRFEAFGLVLAEAMALEVPVVAVDCPCGPAEVLAAGEYGLLVPQGDTDALAVAMTRVLCDEGVRTRLIAVGTAGASRYHPQDFVRKLTACI